MAEFDTVEIVNPLKEEFLARWNGEPYTLSPGERRTFPTFLALHIAKHLSDAVLAPEVQKIKATQTQNPYRPEVAQLMQYDNARRRIALYRILESKELVEQAVKASSYKGFVGNMKEYDDFVSGTTDTKLNEERKEIEENTLKVDDADQEPAPAPKKTRGRKTTAE